MITNVDNKFNLETEGFKNYFKNDDVGFFFKDGFEVSADIDYSCELLDTYQGQSECNHYLDIYINGKYDKDGNEIAFGIREKAYCETVIKEYLEDIFCMN